MKRKGLETDRRLTSDVPPLRRYMRHHRPTDKMLLQCQDGKWRWVNRIQWDRGRVTMELGEEYPVVGPFE